MIKEEKFGDLYWSYNCPLQMCHNDDDTWSILSYMPRKEKAIWIEQRITKEELPSFCKNTACILRNLAELFDALADGKIDTIYYPDEKVKDAISEREKKLKKVE